MSRVAALRRLLAHPDSRRRQLLVQVGRGRLPDSDPSPAVRIRAAFDCAWLARRALARYLDELMTLAHAAEMIVHVWSPAALKWCSALVRGDRRLVVELPPGESVRATACWLAEHPAPGLVKIICPSELTRQRLAYLGIPAARCALIRDPVDLAELEHIPRAQLRADLGLAPDQIAVVVLPPITRAAGSFVAAWAALVLEKACQGVRLVIPSGGREGWRVSRLVSSCGLDALVRYVEPRTSLAELVVLADLAVFLPTRDVSPSGLVWALAAGCPLVASATDVVREFTSEEQVAWLCRPGDPYDAVRQMLRVLEQPEEAKRRASVGRERARDMYCGQGIVDQYERVYAALSG
ncbi:MAG: glycosyltransferase family 4 protein [Planctomycetota bacterium]